MKMIEIGKTSTHSFTLPAEVQTKTMAVLGIRGSGKTTTGAVVTEGMLKLNRQVVIIDPTDVWWGLRSSASGKQAGLPIIILGGPHADVPLQATDGKIIADFIIEEAASAVLSLRHLRKADQRRMVTDFAEQLYHRKGELRHRTPLLVVIDECDAFVPQRVGAAEARMVGAIEDLVRRGRHAGLGVMLISQRAASINKDVLTQCELLVAHRHVSPQDRKALDGWVEYHDSEGQRDEFMRQLGSLEVGTAWFWSPGWLKVFERVAVRNRATFDSSATPKSSSSRRAPRRQAAVDLEALRTKLGRTIQQAEANDPAKLRACITQLERQLRSQAPQVQTDERAISQAVQLEAQRLEREYTGREVIFVRAVHTLQKRLAAIQPLASGDGIELPGRHPEPKPAARPITGPVLKPTREVAQSPRVAMGVGTSESLNKAERLILAALAQNQADGCTKRKLALLAGYSVKGGAFNNSLSALRNKPAGAYISRGGDPIRLSDVGLSALGKWEPLPTGMALAEHWRGQLGKAEREILNVLLDSPTKALTKVEIAEQTESRYAHEGGAFNNALSRLRTLELIDGRGQLKAADVFFEK